MSLLYIVIIVFAAYVVGTVIHLRQHHETQKLGIFLILSTLGLVYSISIVADFPLPTPEQLDRQLYRTISDYIRNQVLGL